MLLNVYPTAGLSGLVNVPSSKPETQRAIFLGALADGISRVYNDLRCLETETMKNACKEIGANIIEHPDHLEIHGVGRSFSFPASAIDAKGSGLVFRTFTSLASVIKSPVVITGDNILRGRVMAPLFDALCGLGVNVECVGDAGKAPIVNWSTELPGGKCVIPGNISSQFITALLLAAPYATAPIEIEVDGEVYSKSYIRQTIKAMCSAGVEVEYSEDLNWFRVSPGAYKACDSYVTGDYTSSSYLLARAALFKGKTVLTNIHEESLQGERAIIDVLKALNISVEFKPETHELIVQNDHDVLEANVEFNAVDFPNIVPTLAAIGAFVKGTFRVVGGSITRLHKAPRVQAMITELQKLGVDITPIFDGDVYDGFEIHGAPTYEGGAILSSWGDHRIFMSLFVASLKCQKSNKLDGFSDVDCSFPDFFDEFKRGGAKFNIVDSQGREVVYNFSANEVAGSADKDKRSSCENDELQAC